jgi:hypothetical protein
VIPKVSAEQLRAKTGKTMRGGAAAGHRKFLHARGKGASGQNNSSPGFARFVPIKIGMRQRSISGDLNYSLLFVFLLVLIISLCSVFWSFLFQDKKEPGPPAAMSGPVL